MIFSGSMKELRPDQKMEGKMKKNRIVALAGAILMTVSMALTGCGGSNASQTATQAAAGGASGEKTFNMKLGHNMAEDHAVNIALKGWADTVKEKSNGTINIEVVPNGVLGSETDMISQIQGGALDMAKVSAATLGNFSKAYTAFSVPYLFNDKDSYFKVLENQDLMKEVYDATADQGFRGFTWLDSGARSFYTKDREIRKPEDLKGLKIRTMDSQMAIDMMNALGGSATAMGYGDIYTAIQQGVIDGAENNVTALRDHADVAKVYSYDMHTMIPDIVVISQKVWDEMSDNQKQIINETAAEMSSNYKQAWKEFEDQVINDVKGKGVTFVEDVDIPAFQEAVKPIYEKLQKDEPDTYALCEKIQAAQK